MLAPSLGSPTTARRWTTSSTAMPQKPSGTTNEGAAWTTPMVALRQRGACVEKAPTKTAVAQRSGFNTAVIWATG